MKMVMENWLLFNPEVHLCNGKMQFLLRRERNCVCYKNRLDNLEMTHICAYKMLLQINFIYLGSKEIYCIVRHAA